MGLSKNFRMNNDVNVQFRAEFFNIFNQVNFANPNTSTSNSKTLGTITATDSSSAIRASSSSGSSLSSKE